MKYLCTMMIAVFVACIAALGASAFDPGPAEAAGNYARKCGGGKILLNANEFRSFHLHNKTRRNTSRAPFCVHPRLQQAARAHSRDMLNRGYFAHGNTGARLRNFGYPWRTFGENIGYNRTPVAMHRAWMRSPGHRSNMLNPRFREIGIGAIPGNFRGSRTVMYTADFGRR
ncbi:MAG: CAP domain-containing protein [Actinomycetota bacterium]|jgi:uncharacterized protein YkwD|nr:CAP domain-containing protein [Actinomycetota bacterium]